MGNFYSKFRDKGSEEVKKDEICDISGVAQFQGQYVDGKFQRYSSGSNDTYAGAKASSKTQYGDICNETSRTGVEGTNVDISHGLSFDTERYHRITEETEVIETEIVIKPELETNNRDLIYQPKETEIIILENHGILSREDTGDIRNDAQQPEITVERNIADVSEREFEIDLHKDLNGIVEESSQIDFEGGISHNTDETVIIDEDQDNVRLSPTIAFDIGVAGLQTTFNGESEITDEQSFPLSFDITGISNHGEERVEVTHETGINNTIEQVPHLIHDDDVILVNNKESEIVIDEEPYCAISNDPNVIFEGDRERILNEFEVSNSVVEPLTLRVDEGGTLSVVDSRAKDTERYANDIDFLPEMTHQYVSNESEETDSETKRTKINTDSAKNCRITLDSLEVRLSLTPDSYESPLIESNETCDGSHYYTDIQNHTRGSNPDGYENDNFLQVPKTLLEPKSRKRKLTVSDTSEYTSDTVNFEDSTCYREDGPREGSKKKKKNHKHKHKHRDRESLTS